MVISNGFLVQYGLRENVGTSAQTLYFPQTFTTAHYAVAIGDWCYNNDAVALSLGIQARTVSSITVFCAIIRGFMFMCVGH